MQGLRVDSFPMRLYEKAKRLGVWNPSEFDFSRDREDWEGLDRGQRQQLLYMVAQFVGGEEAVTIDLLPLVAAIADEGRLEEELFLTTFLFEEGKHTQFFRRWLDEAADSPEPKHLEVFLRFPSWRRLFSDELPQTMGRLWEDRSHAALARASVTYNMIVEGVLAETGYRVYHRALETHGIMPGLRAGLVHIKRDESRHIAYGVYLLARLAAEDPEIWTVIEERMNELFPLALRIVAEGSRLSRGDNPFGLEQEEFVDFATLQFNKRFDRIHRACQRSVAEIEAEFEEDEREATAGLAPA